MEYKLKEIPFGKLVSREFIIRDALQPNTVTVAGEAKAKNSPIDEEGISRLAKSISEVGLLQNMVVIPRSNGTFEVIAGNRRYRALKALGTPKDKKIPVLVVSSKVSRASLLEVALTENLQRKKLSATELSDTIIEILTEKIGSIAIPDYPGSISKDLIIKTIWYINLLLDPHISSNAIEVTQGFKNLAEIVRTELKEELDKLDISFLDYIQVIFPAAADVEIRDSLMNGEITWNEAAVLANVRKRERLTQKDDKNAVKNISDIVKAEKISEEEHKKILSENRNKFIQTFTQEDFEDKEIVRKEASSLGISKEDLQPKKILKVEKVSNDNVEGPQKSIESIVEDIVLSGETSTEEVLKVSSDYSVEQIIKDYSSLNNVKKSVLFSNIITNLESKLMESDLASSLVDEARILALDEIFNFIKKMASSVENEFLSADEKRQKTEEVGIPEQIFTEVLGRILKTYGENLIKIAPKLKNNNTDIRGKAIEIEILTIIPLLITRLTEKGDSV